MFWIYQTIDSAVGQNYYKVGCEELKLDIDELVKMLELNLSKNEMVSFLKINDVKYDGFEKGKDYIIQFNSFDFTFGKNGELKETNRN